MMVAMMVRTIPPTIDAGRMIGMRISVKNGRIWMSVLSIVRNSGSVFVGVECSGYCPDTVVWNDVAVVDGEPIVLVDC